VLIAEDDGVTRKLLQHWLTAWGFEVAVARDGTEAWNVLQQEPSPKLVITDWVMPGVDGIELCRRLRRQSEYYRYILMITGSGDKEHVAHALESGADDCIAKPFQEHDFRARIQVASRIITLQDDLIEAREELRMQAMKDSLTGLWNRAAFKELFELELERAGRTQDMTGLLLLDLDHFKRINDAYGHLTGDVVLRKAARLLRQSVRSYDFVGRFGGEEFLIACPGCDDLQIRAYAERIRVAVESNPIRIGTIEIPITFSIGAAVATPDQRIMASALAVADIALYRAKGAGRNRTAHCGKPPIHVLESMTTTRPNCAACDPILSSVCLVCIPPAISPVDQAN
jgi:diguanylate cyclase (GGDEF)-like protein